MVDISLSQSARPFRLGGTKANAKAKLIAARQTGNGPARAGAEQTKQLRAIAMKREYASCFVDLLLGRGNHPSR